MKTCIFILSLILSSISFSQIEGDWHSAFVVMGNPQRLDIKITQGQRYKVVLSFPDFEESRSLSATNVSFTDDTLRFEAKELSATYQGVFSDENQTISGVLKQSGMKFDINFQREYQEKIELVRPQHPSGTPDYLVKEGSYKNKRSDFKIAYTVTYPIEITSETPIVILASGSGPQDRDETLLGHKPFWVIADYLTKEGNIVYRFDDRGTAKSQGVFADASLLDLATDVAMMVDLAREEDWYDGNPIGVAGHSEGGMHSLLATKMTKHIDFLVFLSCVGTNGRDVLIEQQYLISKKSGESEEDARWVENVFTNLTNIISKYPKDQAQDSLNVYLTREYENAPSDPEMSLLQFIITFSTFNSEYGREFLEFETVDYLKKFKGPIYVVNNAEDIQVPAVKNNEGFELAISKKSKAAGSKIYIELGVNHLFQKCVKCTIDEYGELEETFSINVLEDLSTWIKQTDLNN